MPRRADLCYVVQVPGHRDHVWRSLVECRERGHAGCWKVCHVAVAYLACPLCHAPVGFVCCDVTDGAIPGAHKERRDAFRAHGASPADFVNDAFGVGRRNK